MQFYFVFRLTSTLTRDFLPMSCSGGDYYGLHKRRDKTCSQQSAGSSPEDSVRKSRDKGQNTLQEYPRENDDERKRIENPITSRNR